MQHVEFAELLGLDPNDVEVQLARRQNHNDGKLLDRLIELRRENFPNVRDFAESIGVSGETIEDFEASPVQATVEFLQFYVLGLAVEVKHEIVGDKSADEFHLKRERARKDEEVFRATNWRPETLSAGQTGAAKILVAGRNNG